MSKKPTHAWEEDQRKATEKAERERKLRFNGMECRQTAEENLYEPLPVDGDVQYRERKLKRQKTLSIVTPELKSLLQKIRQLESKLEANCKIAGEKTKEETIRKTPHGTEQHSINSDVENNGFSENVLAENLQIGEGNFMVFCENVDSRTEKQFRQIGDKNVIINVNSCCNKCQIKDKINHQIVPLDTEGEIWLEIKRRSQTDVFPVSPTTPTSPNIPMSPSRSNIPPPSPAIPPKSPINIRANPVKNVPLPPTMSPTGGAAQDPLNDLSASSKYMKHARVPSLPKRKPIEHADSPYDNSTLSVDPNELDDPLYDKIREHPGGRLSLKIPIPVEHEDSTFFTQQNLDSFLDALSVQEYLKAGGESFELNVCTWTYEKEDKYATVDSTQRPPDTEGLYSVPTRTNEHKGARVGHPIEDPGDEPPTEIAPPPPTPKEERKWFHENKDEAHKFLKGKENGSFLVRGASKTDDKHKYTIEFVDQNRIRRLKILKSEDGFYFEYSENKTFNSLDDMINAILKAGLEVKEDNGKWKTVAVHPA